VTCLLYPSTHSKAYDSDYVLSGAADFTVKLWNLYSGVLVHTFAVHGGKVKSIVSCPADINVSLSVFPSTGV
jgi:WD40 repeat protein